MAAVASGLLIQNSSSHVRTSALVGSPGSATEPKLKATKEARLKSQLFVHPMHQCQRKGRRFDRHALANHEGVSADFLAQAHDRARSGDQRASRDELSSKDPFRVVSQERLRGGVHGRSASSLCKASARSGDSRPRAAFRELLGEAVEAATLQQGPQRIRGGKGSPDAASIDGTTQNSGPSLQERAKVEYSFVFSEEQDVEGRQAELGTTGKLAGSGEPEPQPSKRCGPLRILLIDNYDSYTYSLYHLIAQCNCGVPPLVLRNDVVPWQCLETLLTEPCLSAQSPSSSTLHQWLQENNIRLESNEDLSSQDGELISEGQAGSRPASAYLFDCIFISPGPGTPAVPSDIGICMDILQSCGHLPVFGVCMGHQALGVANGAEVGLAPHPVHGQLSPVEHSGHELFSGIPSGTGFEVVRYHSLVVDPKTLPEHLEPIGWSTDQGILSPEGQARHGPTTEQEFRVPVGAHVNGRLSSASSGLQHEGADAVQDALGGCGGAESEAIVMALAHKDLPHYGVQFHPESIETKHGHQLVSNFLNLASEFWRGQGTKASLEGPLRKATAGVRAELGPFQLELPLEVSDAVTALVQGSLQSSPCPLLVVKEPGRLPSILHSDTSIGFVDPTRLSAPCGEAQRVLGNTKDLPEKHSLGHSQTSEGDRELTVHWDVVPGALQRVAGGSSQLFTLLFGDEESGAEDTFWLDSSTAEVEARESTTSRASAPRAPAEHGLPRACWSSGSSQERRVTAQVAGAVKRQGGGQSLAQRTSVQSRPRFSFMGGVGGPLWRKIVYHLPEPHNAGTSAGKAFGMVQGGTLHIQDSNGHCKKQQSPEGGIFEFLEQVLLHWKVEKEKCLGLPFDFSGGLVGYLGYELKAECGAAPSRHVSPHPDAFFFQVDRFLALDHSTGDVYVMGVSCCPPAEADVERAQVQARRHRQEPRCSCHMGFETSPDVPLWRKHLHAGESTSTEQWVQALTHDLSKALEAASVSGSSTSQGAAPLQCPELSRAAGCAERPSVSVDGLDRASVHDALPPRVAAGDSLHPRKGQVQYEAAVRECQAHILLGESYELCLTTQLQGRRHCSEPPHSKLDTELATERERDSRPEDALRFYLNLREVSPAPYGAWFSGAYRKPSQVHGGNKDRDKGGPCAQQTVDTGVAQREAQENIVLCCSSPERFLRLDESGVLEAKPIKGTRPRGATQAEDQQLADSLRTNVKDRAENLMIVDLLRNDLGRVSTIGSVRVPSLMAVESYAFVHQLVSTVQSQLHPSVSAVAAIRAAFPGGSMTGAPKIRSMQLLDDIECSARGPYSGALGYFSLNGTFSFNIVIRTAVLNRNTISVGAGGAVIALSNPTSEFKEMLLKSRSVERALKIF